MTQTAPDRIETERLILRRPAMQDFAAFAAFLASDRAAFVGGPRPEPREAWRSFGHMAGMWMLRGFGMFVMELKDGGTAIGMAGPWQPFDWPEREIGWSLWSAAHEGRGLALEAARATARHALGPLGWPTAVSYIAPGNLRSIAVAERLGSRLDPDAPRPDPEVLVYRIEPAGLIRDAYGPHTRDIRPETAS